MNHREQEGLERLGEVRTCPGEAAATPLLQTYQVGIWAQCWQRIGFKRSKK